MSATATELVLDPASRAGERTETLRSFLEQHGRGCMAYSTLQPGLEYFVHEQLGYLAYLPLWHPLFAPRRLHVVIGNPIARASDYDALLEAYLVSPGAAATVFLEITSEFAEVLSRRGLPVNEVGVEWELDLASFDSELRGSRYSHLRHWRNKARKEGVLAVEGRLSELDANELMSLNRDWLERKGGHEFVGLNRPLTLEDEEDVRYFWAMRDGRLLSLAIFDPMYRDGRIIGYLHNLSRTLHDAPHGTTDLIVLEAIRRFQAEGLEVLSLGLSPLAMLRDEQYRHSRSVKALLGLIFRHGSCIYPFEGNFFHKEKYRGRHFKVYLSSLPGLNLYRVLGVFKALHVF
jgi:phosphatidylglycerol lysyltransferase